MDKKQGFEIILNSNVPFIKQYDIKNGTGLGKFFDEFERINCPCTLHTPSERKVLLGDPKPFFVTSEHAHLTINTMSACYDGMGVHGESIIEVVVKFVKQVFEKCDNGYLICEGTDDSKSYRLKVTATNVVLEQYSKHIAV